MFLTVLCIFLANQNHVYHTNNIFTIEINPTFGLQNNFNHEITLNHSNKLYDTKNINIRLFLFKKYYNNRES